MKRMLNMLGSVGLLGAALMLGGCGDASEKTPPTTGQVAIGPVTGAKVKVTNAASTTESARFSNYSSRTDSSGTFTTPAAYATALTTGNRLGLAYSSTGGTFTNISGATGKAAPDLATPAGFRNITPLSTLYNAASTANKANLVALLGSQEVDTVFIGTIPDSLLLFAKLNNTIGEALHQFKVGSPTVTGTALTAWYTGTATALGILTPDQAVDTTTLAVALTASLPTTWTAAQKTTITNRLTMIARKTVTGAEIR
ncbi:MAG: hypothetical protein WCL71_01910 [Deltaproteobacteria bacterium]